ncbi:cytochrome c biogenesis CcdA family protein [Paraburkholderia dilworthii]|uniref:Cytochrome c biogenesis protein CcdA n=1 Tax=Paraburkholderia dilworthii TaxID=948106 RepID=A0ABW9DGF7_9BURK
MGVGFLAGLVFSVNPVAMAAIPVSLAYLTRARERRQAVSFGGMFIAGMLLTHVVLGFIAGLGGQWVQSLLGRGWGLLLGPLLIFLGFVWAGWLRLSLPSLGFRARQPTGASGAFLLGIPFSIAICPICTPALLVLLGVATSLGSPLTGSVLLLAFAMGRAVPVALGAIAVGWLKGLGRLSGYSRAFEVLGGLALIASGVYMLNAYFFWIPSLAA